MVGRPSLLATREDELPVGTQWARAQHQHAEGTEASKSWALKLVPETWALLQLMRGLCRGLAKRESRSASAACSGLAQGCVMLPMSLLGKHRCPTGLLGTCPACLRGLQAAHLHMKCGAHRTGVSLLRKVVPYSQPIGPCLTPSPLEPRGKQTGPAQSRLLRGQLRAVMPGQGCCLPCSPLPPPAPCLAVPGAAGQDQAGQGPAAGDPAPSSPSCPELIIALLRSSEVQGAWAAEHFCSGCGLNIHLLGGPSRFSSFPPDTPLEIQGPRALALFLSPSI